MMQKARAALAEERLFDAADYLVDLCKGDWRYGSRFNGFVPLNPDFYDNEDIVFTDATPSALEGRVNVGALYYGYADRNTQLLNLSKITHTQLRRESGLFCLNPYRLSRIVLDEPVLSEAVWLNADQSVAHGMRMRMLDIPNYKTDPAKKFEVPRAAQMLVGIQFWLENSCSVYLIPDGADLGFTLPISTLAMARSIFKLRDIEPGRSRRSALKHWVAEHYRGVGGNPDERIEISRYLRGRQDFDWFGLRGTINVPGY